MIHIYRGPRGSGKTLSMVKDALRCYNKGFKIYSNISSLKFGQYITSDFILSLNRSSKLKNCVLVIDEIELFFDSREFSQTQNKQFSRFLQQIRKRNIHILCTCQYISLIDIRIRQQLDSISYPYYDKNNGFCKVYYYNLTKLEGLNGENGPKLTPSLAVFDAKPLFKLYDTLELLE